MPPRLAQKSVSSNGPVARMDKGDRRSSGGSLDSIPDRGPTPVGKPLQKPKAGPGWVLSVRVEYLPVRWCAVSCWRMYASFGVCFSMKPFPLESFQWFCDLTGPTAKAVSCCSRMLTQTISRSGWAFERSCVLLLQYANTDKWICEWVIWDMRQDSLSVCIYMWDMTYCQVG